MLRDPYIMIGAQPIRLEDIAYTAWSKARFGKNPDNGGRMDWGTDTRPVVMQAIDKFNDLIRPLWPFRDYCVGDQVVEYALIEDGRKRPRMSWHTLEDGVLHRNLALLRQDYPETSFRVRKITKQTLVKMEDVSL